MTRQRWYEYGSTFAMRYLFEKRGDGLAMHKHPEGHVHNVIVIKGSVRITSRGSVLDYAVNAPAFVDVLPEWHEICALEDGTELLNIYKNGKPPEYADLPESEKDVAFSRPLENPL